MPAFSENRVQNTPLPRVEILFILIVLMFGLPMIVLIPPGAGYDEEDHLVRVWELARLSFIPGQLSPREMSYPIVFRDFSYRQQGSEGILGEEFWQKFGQASLYEYGVVRREIDTKSVYSPALLLPQAIAMRLFVRDTSLPALMVFYACRFAGLLSYLLLGWLAIRLVPFGKWILLVLAVSPIALFQVATITPDAISNGIGFLFIAGTLRAAEQKDLRWKETGYLALFISLLFLGKLNLIPLILLPFLVIPPARFTQKRIYVFLLAATFILFLVEVVGWNVIAVTRSTPLMANEANPAAQIRYIVSQPLSFLLVIVKDFITNGWNYLQGWINGYGYYYWTPPQIIALFFLLSLAFALLFDPTPKLAHRRLRVGLLVVFAGGYLATLFAEYTTFTPVGLDQIFGVQGRYFISLAPLLFLVLASFSWTHEQPARSPKWLIIFLSIALMLNLAGLFLSFHVPCGSTFYQTGLCYRPLFKDFPSEARLSAPISNDLALTQEILVACNGFSELRILLSPSGGAGTTRFILHDRTSPVLFDTLVMNSDIPTEDWYPLRFNPDWNSGEQQYVLEVFGMDLPASHGLRVFYTTQPEFDLGNLIENGEFLQEDIVLQYGCVTGLRKMWMTGR
ncbi:MAG TPA: DUF2142 domain-containing protein [Anaerolineales bacterium]|nr:DUF2142 domain-containing protein [Anaerolineales bacterium]